MYPFLLVKNIKCREAGSLGATRIGKLRYKLSIELKDCRVGLYDNNEKQIKSLRKKINEHGSSHIHKLAEDIHKR